MKTEIEAKLKTLLLWSKWIDVNEEQEKEETKSNKIYAVSSKIYGKTLELCKLPTQSLKKSEGSWR